MDGLYTLPPPPTFLLIATYFYCKQRGRWGDRETEVTIQRGEQPIRDTLEFSEITNFLGLMAKKKK